MFIVESDPMLFAGHGAFWLQDSAGFRQWESFPNPVFPTATCLDGFRKTQNDSVGLAAK
jgi:hypothetical protein